MCLQGVSNVAAVSLQIGYPTLASVPHSVVNGFKVHSTILSPLSAHLTMYACVCFQNLLAVAVATDITFKEAEQVS